MGEPGRPALAGVPRAEVDAAVALAFDRYDVAELAADPWGWRSEIETWANRHGERHVLEWNTANAQRMAPAEWARPSGSRRRASNRPAWSSISMS